MVRRLPLWVNTTNVKGMQTNFLPDDRSVKTFQIYSKFNYRYLEKASVSKPSSANIVFEIVDCQQFKILTVPGQLLIWPVGWP
jgi:hypothetical protein